MAYYSSFIVSIHCDIFLMLNINRKKNYLKALFGPIFEQVYSPKRIFSNLINLAGVKLHKKPIL